MIEVISGGFLSTVQDTLPRSRLAHLGVPPGGAMDRPAAEDANWLVGNAATAAVLEMTAVAPSLLFTRRATIAVCGADLSLTVDGRRLPVDVAVRVRAGSVLEGGDRAGGLRAYLAAGGGIDVPLVLGSRSTDLRSGFGGLEGRALRAGDVVPVGPSIADDGRVIDREGAVDPAIGVLPGLHAGRAALCRGTWRVGMSDRQGMRLLGPRLAGGAADLPSFGVVPGAIQLPPDGVPVVLLAEAQPTGGYPVIGVVRSGDLPVLAQAAPGDVVRFRTVGYEDVSPVRTAQRIDEMAALKWT